jgi:hypothetical protein
MLLMGKLSLARNQIHRLVLWKVFDHEDLLLLLHCILILVNEDRLMLVLPSFLVIF